MHELPLWRITLFVLLTAVTLALIIMVPTLAPFTGAAAFGTMACRRR